MDAWMELGRYDAGAHDARNGRVRQHPTRSARQSQLLIGRSQAASTQNGRPTYSVFHRSNYELGLYRIYFFPIRPEPDFAGFGMTNLAGGGFSN